MTIRKILPILLLLFLISIPSNSVSAEQPSLPSPDEIISLINQYRQQNGLNTLTYNPLLASLAQQQSNYQAKISTGTHTGPGGTTPQQRAEAAGYGGGEWFYLSEIIYWGSNATPSSAMTWWKNSSTHNYYILSANYTEIGAGVATDGKTIYFTAELGGATGGGGGEYGTAPTSPPSSTSTEPEPTSEPVAVVIPVSKSTPHADGSIHHIVQQGQSLWNIAALYETSIDKIMELNEMDSNYIFPGDDLLVRLASDQPAITPTIEPSPEPTEEDQPTNSPTSSPVPEITQMLGTPFSFFIEQPPEPPTLTPLPPPTSEPEQPESPASLLGNKPIVSTLVIAALVILLLVVLASGFIQIKPGRPDRDDLVK